MDFVSQRVARVLPVIEERKLAAMLAQFRKALVSESEKLALLNLFAPYNYFPCALAATILMAFETGDTKVSVDPRAVCNLRCSAFTRY